MKIKYYALLLSVLLGGLANVVSAQPGTLDPSFGSGGVVTTDVSTSDDQIRATAIQSNGKIVAVGYSDKPSQFTVTRYNTNGTLDTNFGTGGIVKTAFSGPASGRAVVIQTDGKILAAGDAEGKFVLVRYTSAGQLDTSFGSQGKVLTAVGNNALVEDIALQSDGKIIAAGFTGKPLDFVVARYTSNGSLDATFGNNGIVITDFADGDDRATSVKIQSDGKIVVAGSATDEDLNTNFAVVRYNANGTPDTNFNGSGKVTTTTFCGVEALGLQADGKIVVTGSSDDIYLARYTSGGALDTNFGTGGVVTTNIGGDSDNAYGLLIDPMSRILISGSTISKNNEDMIVARYQGNGSLDASFDNGDGIVIVPLGSPSDIAHSIALQSNGGIIAGGSKGAFGSKEFAIIRLTGMAPTAADATISGTVSFGTSRASQVRIERTNSQGNSIYTMTDSTGHFYFYNQPVGETYILTAYHDFYTFTPSSIVVNLTGDYTAANFTAQ